MNIKTIIKDNCAFIDFYRNGNLFYFIEVDDILYNFPVPLDDVGTATLGKSEKGITMMRFIRKALEGGTFVKVREIKDE